MNSVLREANWLTADRAHAAMRVLLLALAGLALSVPFLLPAMQVGRDFASFWTAARLALDGRTAEAYGDPARAALAALFGNGTYPPFIYPPTALLIWLPFALMPFPVAVAVWLCVTGYAYALVIRAVGGVVSVLSALSFPAVMVCGFYGQNGLFTAALLGGSAAALDRYPVLAGALLGCLSYKPQLFMLVPLALLIAGRWRALAASLVTAAILAACSLLAFGPGAWRAFVAAIPDAQAWIVGGVPGFGKYISLYAACRLLGLPEAAASAIQGTLTVAAIGALLFVVRRRPGGRAEISALVVAILLSVPFLGEYDFVMAAVPGAWIVAEAVRYGWKAYERVTLALLYLAPLVTKAASMHDLPLAAIASIALAALVYRRAVVTPGTVTQALARPADL